MKKKNEGGGLRRAESMKYGVCLKSQVNKGSDQFPSVFSLGGLPAPVCLQKTRAGRNELQNLLTDWVLALWFRRFFLRVVWAGPWSLISVDQSCRDPGFRCSSVSRYGVRYSISGPMTPRRRASRANRTSGYNWYVTASSR